jgi:PIN domain nuclease of toxin-antitoxin system
MTDASIHLTEDERQRAAEGSPLGERGDAHLQTCAGCADDVARIARFMNRIREAPAPSPLADDLWPEIRTRIEASKVTPIAPARASRRAPRRRLIGIAAAVMLAAMAGTFGWRTVRGHRAAAADSAAIAVAGDSVRAYEEEAKVLLDRLELQRAMLRPEAVAAIDHDLAVVDSAIAEVQVAIAQHPNDPALRQMLAMAYRRKVDVLLRVGNAT